MPAATLRHAALMLRRAPDAKSVVYGTQSTWGVLNDDEQIVQDETGRSVTLRELSLTIAADSLTGVAQEDAITVGGVTYVVRSRPMPRENGDLWNVRLVEADA